MLPNVADELLRQLASRVELGQIPDDSTPDDLARAVDPSRRILDSVEIEGVPEIGDRPGDVAAEPVPLLLHGGGRRG